MAGSYTCYLQHPLTAPGNTSDGQWALIEAYRAGSLNAVHQIERQRVAQNRQRLLEPDGAKQVPARRSPSQSTIEHLSVDGSFVAEGYEQRMNRWVSSVWFERTTG